MKNYYENYRDKIKSGDLIVKSTDKINSLFTVMLAGVQIITRSSYDHVGIAWKANNRLFIIEAIIPKVVITPLSSYGEFYHLNIDREWEDSDANILLSKVGMAYSKWAILKAYFKLGKPSKDTWYCSKLAADFYLETGYITKDELGCEPKSVVEGLLSRSGNGLVKVTTAKKETV